MYASAGNMTDFSGVLVQKKYKPGQKLVFDPSSGLRLSTSQNLGTIGFASVDKADAQEYVDAVDQDQST